MLDHLLCKVYLADAVHRCLRHGTTHRKRPGSPAEVPVRTPISALNLCQLQSTHFPGCSRRALRANCHLAVFPMAPCTASTIPLRFPATRTMQHCVERATHLVSLARSCLDILDSTGLGQMLTSGPGLPIQRTRSAEGLSTVFHQPDRGCSRISQIRCHITQRMLDETAG